MDKKMNRIYAFLESNRFLYFVLGFFTFECVWLALSFRFPMVFDERFHMGVIDFFGRTFSPFVDQQPSQYDIYGNLAYGNASIYHYLLSFPYRLIVHISNDQFVQVVSLRLINVVMAVGGLWAYVRLGNALGVPKKIAHVGALLYSLIPVTILVAATVSYDNLLFLITPLFLLYGIRLLRNEISALNIVLFFGLGLFGSLVKFTFVPVFVTAFIYICIDFYRHRIAPITRLFSFQKLHMREWLAIVVVLVVCVLFFARYVVAVARYHTPIPDCSLVLSEKRCIQNPVYYMVKNAEMTKQTRTPDMIHVYAEDWMKEMVEGFEVSASPTEDGTVEVAKPLPLISFVTVVGSYVAIGVILLMWRSMKKSEEFIFVSVVSAGLVITLFMFNALSYYQANTDLNVQTRYILSTLPIMIMMALVATSLLLKKYRKAKLLLLLFTLLLLTQGGGLVKHIVSSKDSWYWPKHTIISINHNTRDVLQKLVKEH